MEHYSSGEESAAGVRRDSLQTLLVSLGCGGAMGLLPGWAWQDPGKRSLKLGIPGLCYATPLGLVSGGVGWWKMGVGGWECLFQFPKLIPGQQAT